MKILIFGATGYIGSEFKRQLSLRDCDVYVESSRPFMNGGSHNLYRFIKSANPDVIINCSAFIGGKNIEGCESDKHTTISANVLFPTMLGDICDSLHIVLGHFSSGCIFNGHPDGGFKETDEPNMSFEKNSCCFYTGTKLLAEQQLKHLDSKYIWRIRLPFDEVGNPRNFLSKMMMYDKLVLASNSLSHRKESVSACIECLFKRVPYGTYHVTNPGCIRTDEVTKMISNFIPSSKAEFSFFKTIEEFDKFSKIPRSNNFLNTEKLKSVGIVMRPVHQAVEETLKEWR